MSSATCDPIGMLRPRRRITGISAILLPFADDGTIDWSAFRAHVLRTSDAGLMPAVNMDTGYVHLLDDPTRLRILDETRHVLQARPFVAGAYLADRPGSRFDRDAYLRQAEFIQIRGGIPIISNRTAGLDCPTTRSLRLTPSWGATALVLLPSNWAKCSLPSARSIPSRSISPASKILIIHR